MTLVSQKLYWTYKFVPVNANERTLGDGMDNIDVALSDFTKKNVKFELKLKSTECFLNSLKCIEPKGRIIYTIPKYIPTERTKRHHLMMKPQEPKFIPYEPFKGAVESIRPICKVYKKDYVKDKNNIDIHDLVRQMAEMRMTELKKAKMEAINNEEILLTRKQWEEQKQAFETDIKNLRESNSHLENQLKFQIQVYICVHIITEIFPGLSLCSFIFS